MDQKAIVWVQQDQRYFIESYSQLNHYSQQSETNEAMQLRKHICENFWFDRNAIRKILDQWPKIVMGEQAGARLQPLYKARVELYKVLMQQPSYDKENSGILALSNDLFNVKTRSSKVEHNSIYVVPEMMPYRFLNKKECDSYYGRTYDTVPVPVDAIHRVVEMLKLLYDEPTFWRVLFEWYRQNIDEKDRLELVDKKFCVSGVYKDPIKTHKVFEFADGCKLSSTQKRLLAETMHIKMQEGKEIKDILMKKLSDHKNEKNRNSYRNTVNGDIFTVHVGQIDTLFNQMILAIENPIRMSETYKGIMNKYDAIAVMAIIGDMEDHKGSYKKYIPVVCDEGKFYKQLSPTDREEIHRSYVQQLAQENKTCGPSAFLEYLLLFLMWYVLIDDWHDVGFSVRIKEYIHSVAQDRWLDITMPMISIRNHLDKNLAWFSYYSQYSKQELSRVLGNDFLSFTSPSLSKVVDNTVEEFMNT